MIAPYHGFGGRLIAPFAGRAHRGASARHPPTLKLPFLVIFGFYGLERALPGTLSLPFLGRVPLASLGLAAVAGLGLAGTASVLIWSR